MTNAGGPALSPRGRRAAVDLWLADDRQLELEVHGDSMLPTLAPGSRVNVRRHAEEPPKPGDLVAFFVGPSLVSHRVLAVGRRGAARGMLLTQGDNRRRADPPLAIERVLGDVLAPGTQPTGPDGPSMRSRRPLSRALAWLTVALFELHPALCRPLCLAPGRGASSDGEGPSALQRGR